MNSKDELEIEKRNKVGKLSTYRTWRSKDLNNELECKLPNEFKGSINSYNHRNTEDGYFLDENQYNVFKF